MGEFVRLEVADGIGTIRLDRPKMNALNLQVQNEIEECAREATVRDDVAAVIVYGGERVFAAGADIKEMQTMSYTCLLYTSDAADERSSVDLGGRRIIKTKNTDSRYARKARSKKKRKKKHRRSTK